MDRHRARRIGTIAVGTGGAPARRLLLALVLSAAPLPAAMPPEPVGDDPPVSATAFVAPGDDARIGAGADAGARGFDPGRARALPAKQLRVGGPQRPVHAPLALATPPGVATPPAPLRTGWLAAGTRSPFGRPTLGSAGIRAPPGPTA